MGNVTCGLCGLSSSKPFLEKFGGLYLQCNSCGFIYSDTEKINFTQYNKEHNELLIQAYADKHYSVKKQNLFKRKLKLFELYRKHNRILELGCNVGGFLLQANNQNWQSTGVEPVAAVADYGRSNYDLDIKACALEEAGFPDNHFDAIFSNAVLEHLQSPSRVLKEVFRVLRPGGVIFASTVNIESYTWHNIGETWKLVDPRAHLGLYTPTTLSLLFEKSGFNILKLNSQGVRFRLNKDKPLSGIRKLGEEIKKGSFSMLARYNLKGDRINILAQKPSINT